MGAPKTGSDGKVKFGAGPTDIDDIKSWSLSRSVEAKPYNSSSTAGQTKRVAGNKDWSGSFELYMDAADMDPGFDEGDLVDLELHSDDGVHKYTGNALITDIGTEVEVEGADIESQTITFEGNGVLTES